MKLDQILANTPHAFSFEFFPPKTEQSAQRLKETAARLAKLNPAYVSVTYGAGGSTRARTRQIVVEMQRELNLTAVPHLTCVGSSKDELREIIKEFSDAGIHNIMALRGDPPHGDSVFTPHPEGLQYASELVSVIAECGDFGVGVAGYPEGHPETPSKLADLDHLKTKVDKGASCVITQLFFDNRDFYDFRERCELVGIDIPIVAGIMPILTRKGIERMAGMCGARLPAKLIRRLNRFSDNEADVAKVGIEWATTQCMDLLDHDARGIHFYTLNRSTATETIYRSLGV